MIEKADIEELVLDPKKSNLKTHFNDMFFIKNHRYSGEIREKEILLWYSSHWLRGGYPIFHLQFDSENKLVGIKSELNPFGKLFDKIAMVMIGIFSLLPILGNGFMKGWLGSVFILFVALVLFLIMRKASKSEKKIMVEELKETIENIEKEKFPEKFVGKPQKEIAKENEWTFKKILTRIFFYPISVLVIYFCITEILPNGKVTHAFFGISVCGLYLVADILNILKK
ncbi:hypothetical protein ACFSSG_17790 [Euzebyella marina]|nr:hypothetical protein [Euzebyella marina]